MRKFLEPEEILRKKAEYLIPCIYHFYTRPIHLVKGSMQYLFDHAGKRYLDCFSGVSVANCGHCNPEITRTIASQLLELQHTTTIYLTQNMAELAEVLAGITPGKLKKTFFCASGSEANEGAALLASIFTGRHSFISLHNSLHGRTKMAMSLTGLSFWRTDSAPVEGISFAPSPYCYRCPYGLSQPECDFACANEIENLIRNTNPRQVAAFFAEPIQGNGGIIAPPPGYFKRVKEILTRYSVLLVVDEVQTGFGRTGKMFAIEHYETVPDIITMAKGLGNGVPIAAFIAAEEIADKYTRPGASTFGGNPVAAAAGLATIKYISKNGLADRAADLGRYFKQGLSCLMQRYPIIGDVRGLGLMIGAELVYPDKSPATKEADYILEKMKDLGCLVGKNGSARNVIAFQPPLVIEKNNIDDTLNAMEIALKSLNC